MRQAAQNTALATEDISRDNKERFRPLLHWLGGYLVICGGSGIWYDEIMRRVHRLRRRDIDLVTIGGVRFPSDAERVRNAGGSIVQICRPDLQERDNQDLTERERGHIQPDAVVVNDGSLADLARLAAGVFADLQVHQLQAKYWAADKPAHA